MIHALGKTYGISPRESEQLTEYDYFVMVGSENLENERQEYITKTYKK